MNRAEVFMTLAKAGIDPAKVFPGLHLTESPRLRAPSAKELAVVRSFIGLSPEIGKLERKSPLPVGRYWQDIFEKQAHDWDLWLQQHEVEGPNRSPTSDDSVSLEKFEFFRADPLRDGSWLPEAFDPNAGRINSRMWVLFNVLKPVDWPATKLGFPTIADQTVQTSADTADNPPGPSPIDEVKDAVVDAVKPVLWVAGIVGAFLLVRELRR
jgi:hypothetical protein